MENLDLREILKDVPKGTKLYSPLFGECYLDNVNSRIELLDSKNNKVWLYYNGKYNQTYDGECLLFPSKEQRDWSQFKVPCQFKIGDVIYNKDAKFISIYEKDNHRFMINYCPIAKFFPAISTLKISMKIDSSNYRLATPEESKLFYDGLQKLGYFWNTNTNLVEKYKFKIGDRIQDKTTKQIYTIYDIEYDKYKICKNIPGYLYAEYQDNYELYQEKFDITTLKPYDKVLVRFGNNSVWEPQLFSHLDINLNHHVDKFVIIGFFSVPQCIPYEGNEHLVGTKDECDEFYKNW